MRWSSSKLDTKDLDAFLSGLAGLQHLTALNCTWGTLTGSGLAALSDLPLTALDLGNCRRLTGAGLEAGLQGWTRLER
jgi:hypothetical protein